MQSLLLFKCLLLQLKIDFILTRKIRSNYLKIKCRYNVCGCTKSLLTRLVKPVNCMSCDFIREKKPKLKYVDKHID